MADAFDDVFGQPQVRAFLRGVVAKGRMSHAYLFCGPAGSNKTVAAYALAQAALCEEGCGCGGCDACRRVARRTHPDVHFFSPEGVNAYLVEQMRELIADVALAPVRGPRKVYILDRVDLLGASAANAFLKTLEEPPEGTMLILLGRTQEAVLPTIASRCQVIPFRAIPPSEAAGLVAQNAGSTPEQARIALAACDGSVSRAVAFLRSGESRELRRQTLSVLAGLPDSDDWDLARAASGLVVQAKAPLDEVRAEQERDRERAADFLSPSALKAIERRDKRTETARGRELLLQVTAIVRTWLRDVAAVCAEAGDSLSNVDAARAVADAAAASTEARAVRALRVVGRYEEALSRNVSPETCMGAMLMEVRECLYGDGPASPP